MPQFLIEPFHHAPSPSDGMLLSGAAEAIWTGLHLDHILISWLVHNPLTFVSGVPRTEATSLLRLTGDVITLFELAISVEQ